MDNSKNLYQAQLLYNRISKKYRQLKKWARKNRISCYRLYDRDIPEIPLCIEIYTFLPEEIETKTDAAKYISELSYAISQNGEKARELTAQEKLRTYIQIYLYERPYEKTESEENEWLKLMSEYTANAVGISIENIIIKTRKRQRENDDGIKKQYEKNEVPRRIKGIICEQGQLFYLNLTDYIDSGLFFDHRPLRLLIRNDSKGKRILNLFCYTGSFSVYAAEGKASFVESVDMSNTYIEWTARNLKLNGFSDKNIYKTTRADVVHFLNDTGRNIKENEKFDIIILDPPTFSNSKNTDTMLDLNRDWPILIEKCTHIMSDNGILYFSTNSRKLKMNPALLPDYINSEEITDITIPEDYRNTRIHRVWKITAK